MYSCTFIGHRNCPESIKNKLFLKIEDLVTTQNVDTFYVGTHGNFDRFVYETLIEIEKKHKIKIFVVLAYLNQKSDYIYYDNEKTIFPDCLTKTPLRFAINKRNHYMIDKSNFLICFLKNRFSNTYSFVEYAIKNNVNIINLSDTVV